MAELVSVKLALFNRRVTHRKVRERWVIEGTLWLDAPAHFGSGSADAWTDMPVLLDETTGQPLLTGASLAGALRNYLRAVECGDGMPFPAYPKKDKISKEEAKRLFAEQQDKERELAANLLFGGYRSDDEGLQSPLIVDDALGDTLSAASGYELRDGVAIDGKTRTAAEDKKFDIQLLAAGTTFKLHFELVASMEQALARATKDLDDEQAYEAYRRTLLNALATALDGLAKGSVTLGARKRRGYGRCHVDEWQVRHYDLTQTADLLAWLASEQGSAESPWFRPVADTSHADIGKALGATLLNDNRQHLVLNATFSIVNSLLIRSGFGDADTGPDMVHLHAYRSSERVPIIPGTSWAGVLRHRAVRIGRTLANNDPENRVQKFVDDLFGPSEIKYGERYARSSRLSVAESLIEGGRSLVQTRVKIDRFTGGAFESALFEEQPLYGDENTRVKLALTLKPPSPADRLQSIPLIPQAEIGLLLLLLKDLWTGDLHIGGEMSVGRGRLRGLAATLQVDDQTWQFTSSETGSLTVMGDRAALQNYVDAFNNRMQDHE